MEKDGTCSSCGCGRGNQVEQTFSVEEHRRRFDRCLKCLCHKIEETIIELETPVLDTTEWEAA